MSGQEFDLIDRYFSDINRSDESVVCGVGDDAAVLNLADDQALLVSVDTLVKDVHFSSNDAASDVAFKALAVNASDMAAMGGSPRWATLALTLPELEHEWLKDFAVGFREAAEQFRISLVGGDTTRGPLTISVQIMGTVTRGQSIRRSRAKAGDLIYVSGELGAAGLAYRADADSSLAKLVSENCLQRLRRPMPRVELGRQLQHFAHAAIDISDGLVTDLGHVLRASEVGAEIELEKIPFCRELDSLDEARRLEIALASGDDYELCFTLNRASEDEMNRRLEDVDCPVTCIGRITDSTGIKWVDESGEEVKLELEGYQHF